jgi:hypothetical protein
MRVLHAHPWHPLIQWELCSVLSSPPHSGAGRKIITILKLGTQLWERQWASLLVNRICPLWSFCSLMYNVDLPMEGKALLTEQLNNSHSTFLEGLWRSESHQGPSVPMQLSCVVEDWALFNLQWIWESNIDSNSIFCSRLSWITRENPHIPGLKCTYGSGKDNFSWVFM